MINLFSRDLILTSLKASCAAEALTQLGNTFLAKGYVKPSFIAAIIEREKKFPTGLELGDYNVAIPHTDAEHVIRDGIAIAILDQPVSFARMDEPGKAIQVQIIFMLALSKPHSHLVVLQRLSGFLQNTHFLADLLTAQSIDKIYFLLDKEFNKEQI